MRSGPERDVEVPTCRTRGWGNPAEPGRSHKDRPPPPCCRAARTSFHRSESPLSHPGLSPGSACIAAMASGESWGPGATYALAASGEPARVHALCGSRASAGETAKAAKQTDAMYTRFGTRFPPPPEHRACGPGFPQSHGRTLRRKYGGSRDGCCPVATIDLRFESCPRVQRMPSPAPGCRRRSPIRRRRSAHGRRVCTAKCSTGRSSSGSACSRWCRWSSCSCQASIWRSAAYSTTRNRDLRDVKANSWTRCATPG